MSVRWPGPVPAAAAGRHRAWPGPGWVVWVPAIVAILCYLPALRNGFALDDVVIIADDAAIHHLSTLVAALGRPYWYDVGHLYRPLTTLSFGLEWTAGHGAPLLFHAINIAWHAGISALVARLALRWWPAPAALTAGLWFAIHPVHAEAVANIVGRSAGPRPPWLRPLRRRTLRDSPAWPGTSHPVARVRAGRMCHGEQGDRGGRTRNRLGGSSDAST